MNRRRLLGLGALDLLGLWAARPNDHGRPPHSDYFAQLNSLPRREGGAAPCWSSTYNAWTATPRGLATMIYTAAAQTKSG